MTNFDHKLRDGMIRAAQEARKTDDTKIMQKVNAVNREGFLQRFPGQIEHNMRLISERLQWCLTKDEQCVLSDPGTWPAQPAELRDLAEALSLLNSLRADWPTAPVEQP
jgi:hypothetical protein